MNKANFALGTALVAVVIAIGSFFYTGSVSVEGPNAGAVTPGTRFPHGITVGNPSALGVNPANISKVLTGTCSLIAPTFTVAASTTVSMDCATPGVVSGDAVFASFATSTSLGNGWFITGVSASTTAGFSTLRVTNFTGASGLIPASIASSTLYAVLGVQ